MGMHSILCVCPSVSRIPLLMCCWKTAAVFEIIMMSHYKNNTCQYFITFVCLAPSLSESQLKHNKSCCDKKTRCITFIFHVNLGTKSKDNVAKLGSSDGTSVLQGAIVLRREGELRFAFWNKHFPLPLDPVLFNHLDLNI